jgi:hypothetical protein
MVASPLVEALLVSLCAPSSAIPRAHSPGGSVDGARPWYSYCPTTRSPEHGAVGGELFCIAYSRCALMRHELFVGPSTSSMSLHSPVNSTL